MLFIFFIVIVLVLGIIANAAFAAPFLTCDPYPTTVSEQAVPTEFVVTISGIAEPVVTPAVPAGANQVTMKLDLGPLNLTGSRTATVRARNMWGVSGLSDPFVFFAGTPASPSRLGLTAQ